MNNAEKYVYKARDRFQVSRRRMIKLSGMFTALTVIPPSLAEAASFLQSDETPREVSPTMQRLSTYMASAGTRALPDEVIEQAKHHVLDTFAAMVSGSDLPPGRAQSSSLAPMAARNRHRGCSTCADRSKRPLPMACSRIPMKPTIRTLRPNRTREVPLSPPRSRRESNLESMVCTSCAPSRLVMTLGRASEWRWAARSIAPRHIATATASPGYLALRPQPGASPR